MQSAQIVKASERAHQVAYASLGIAIASSVLVSEGLVAVLYLVLGAAILGGVLAGIPRRINGFLCRPGRQRLAGFYAIALPLIGAVVFALYPVAIGFLVAGGLPLDTKFIVIAAVSAVLCLANLTTLVNNAIVLLRRNPAGR